MCTRNSEVELKNSTWEMNAENFLKLETLNHKSKKLENIKQCKHQGKANLYILYSNCWKPATKKTLKAARTKKYCLQEEKDKNAAVPLIRNHANKTREWYLCCAERKKKKRSTQDFRFPEKISFKVKGEILSQWNRKMN